MGALSVMERQLGAFHDRKAITPIKKLFLLHRQKVVDK